MASTGNWSYVGKTKKSKIPTAPMTKQQKKQYIENMPRIDPLDPVKECSTIYDAFVAKEQQKGMKKKEKFAEKVESSREPNSKGISDGAQKKKLTSSRKKPEQESRKRPYEVAIKEVTEVDLKSVLLQSQDHFPDKADLWLKDLVTWLNFKLEFCLDTDKHLNPENKDYPGSLLRKDCRQLVTSVLGDCSEATLEHVTYFCLATMLEEAHHGHATYGYKIFLQLLARARPDILIAKLTQYGELVRSTVNRPDSCLTLLWALGQAGAASHRHGLRVWLDVMLPHLGMPRLGNYCIQYLENLLISHKDHAGAAGEIRLKEYFHLLDLIYGSSLSPDLRKHLIKMYPQLKVIAYGKDPSSSLRNFFPSYLTRAMPGCSSDLKVEVLSCLTECLAKDKQSYPLWCQLYLKHLTQSRVLMEYLTRHWDTVSGRLDHKLLQQTLMTFLRTNDESSQGRHTADWASITTVCEELLKKLTRPRFPWRWVMFFLISTVVAIVAYDVHTSKTFMRSRTVGFLEAYGVLGFLQQMWAQASYYSSTVYMWLQVNVPVYWELVYTTVSPYVVKLLHFCSHIEENTRQYRNQAIDKIYSLAPEFWQEFGRYLGLCWDFIIDYSYWIYGHIARSSSVAYLWVDSNIIHGNFSTATIQQTLSWSADKVQHFTGSAIEWCKQLWT